MLRGHAEQSLAVSEHPWRRMLWLLAALIGGVVAFFVWSIVGYALVAGDGRGTEGLEAWRRVSTDAWLVSPAIALPVVVALLVRRHRRG